MFYVLQFVLIMFGINDNVVEVVFVYLNNVHIQLNIQ